MTTHQPRERARWRVRRWGKRLLKWLGLLAGLAVVAVYVLLHNLDQPWVKRRVQAIVAKQVGVAVDYGSVRLALSSGIDVDDLVVSSPLEVRGAAPELARIGHVAARWSLRSLLTENVRVARIDLTDVALTVAVDEKGRTSLDALFKGPSVPLSRQAESLLGSPLPVGAVDVQRLSVTVVNTVHGAVVERTTVRGVALELRGEPAERGGGARLWLGSDAAQLALDMERQGSLGAEGSAHARFWAIAAATSSDLALALDLHVVDQNLVPGVGLERALRAAGRARFDVPASRTDVMVDAEIADGTGRANVALATIPDEGPPVVHCAVGDVDAAGLLALLPAELVPLHAERAHLRYRIVEAVLSAPPRLNEGGAVEVEGDVADLRVALHGGGSLGVQTGALGLHMLPDSTANMAVHGSVTLDGAALATTRGETRTGGVKIQIDGRGSPAGAFDGSVELRFASVQTSGSFEADARDGRVALHFGDVHVDLTDPLATRGDLALTGEIASVSARDDSSRALASTLVVHGHLPLSGPAPYAANAEVTAARIQVSGRARETLADAAARVAVDLTNAMPDLGRPIASTGIAHVEISLGDTKAAIDAAKEPDAVDYELHAHAATLEPLRRLLPADALAMIPLRRMALAVESKGRVERISSALPEIRQHTKLDLDQPAYGSVSARALAITLDSRGTATRQDVDVDLRARALSSARGGTADEHLTLSAKLDRAQPALRLVVGIDGRAKGELAVAASFDRARHALAYDLEGSASELASLAPLLAGIHGLENVDLSALEVGVAAKGELLGVVTDVEPDGTARFAPSPALTAAVTGTMDVRVEHFRFARRAVLVMVPKLAWHGDFGVAGGRRTLAGHLDVGSVHLAVGPHVLDAAGISDHLSATVVGDLRNPDADVADHVVLTTASQDFVPAYPVGDVSSDFSLRRDHAGIVRLDELRVVNAAGGTTVSVAGDLDVSGRRRKLALEGALEQDVARLSTHSAELAGRGRAWVTTRVESSDLVVFRTQTNLRFNGVDLRLPRQGIVIESADGEVPIELEVRAAAGTATLLRRPQSSPFALLRFVDQHPLLSRKSFLSAGRITTPYVSIAPFTANLQIDHNIVALEQLEMGVRGGWVTGQGVLDYDGEKSTLELHLRASGVRSSHDEPFDGNAAFVVSAEDRSLDGRGEILRIGARHFVDLLDLVDPTHTNASVNRIRSALALGYPSRVSVAFRHGFANAHVQLGGLASLFSVDDIRGIPVGPLMERTLKAWSRSRGRR